MAEAQGLYQKALKTVQKHQMIQRGDTVAAGVSGGADSVAMLDFFYHLRERMPLQITVCHLNHQLRGEESDRDEAFVRELAERYRLPFLGKRVDAAAWAGAGRTASSRAAVRVHAQMRLFMGQSSFVKAPKWSYPPASAPAGRDWRRN